MVINMKTYYIEGLDCANCALKIENKLNTLPGLKHATYVNTAIMNTGMRIITLTKIKQRNRIKKNGCLLSQ